MNRLAESDAELARGEYVSAEELAETMRRRQASYEKPVGAGWGFSNDNGRPTIIDLGDLKTGQPK
jgi:hypothetical protein